MEGENGKAGLGEPQPGGPQPATAPVPQLPESSTPEQVTKLVSDALAKQGREHRAALLPITSERDSLKTQLTGRDGEITDLTGERDDLKAKIDDLASDDPQRFNLVKRESALTTQVNQLRTDRRTLEADKATHATAKKLTDDTLREITVMDVATAKKDASGKAIGNPEQLKEVCEKIGATTEEQIQTVADTLWPDAVTPATAALKILSGATSGGAQGLNGLSPEEKVRKGLAAKIKEG
ncbi:hypothetical protein LCGC14_0808650 [marine sediment metagenome]|uniref:Scaffolding protein n=1 Tax=marine sediment metagenome TaxID=412755 RepID=A0A0F9S7H5_9ZZZZ